MSDFNTIRLLPICAAICAIATSCGNTSSDTSADTAVPAEESPRSVRDITVPSFSLSKPVGDSTCTTQFLFDRATNRLSVAPDGSPAIFTVDSLGLEHPRNVMTVVARTIGFIPIKKGDTYYEDGIERTATSDMHILSEETWPYGEIYNFDRQGRLTSYYFGNYSDCNDEDVLTIDYGPGGTFTYRAEHYETDDFPPRLISGKWDGNEWIETVFGWDYESRAFKMPVTYTLCRFGGNAMFFTITPDGESKPFEVRYRYLDGRLSLPLDPGRKLSEQLPEEKLATMTRRTDPDPRGNSLTVTRTNPHLTSTETTLEITYYTPSPKAVSISAK